MTTSLAVAQNSLSTVGQNGDDNDAFVYQKQNPARSGHRGYVYQNGDGNEADINQDGDGHYAYVHQGLFGSGSNNVVNVTQM